VVEFPSEESMDKNIIGLGIHRRKRSCWALKKGGISEGTFFIPMKDKKMVFVNFEVVKPKPDKPEMIFFTFASDSGVKDDECYPFLYAFSKGVPVMELWAESRSRSFGLLLEEWLEKCDEK